MYSESPPTTAQRHCLALLMGAVPSIYIGFCVGLFAAGCGAQHSLAAIFLRTLICAAPAATLALIAPRAWLLPSLIYAFTFYCGYDSLDTARAFGALSVASPGAIFIASLTGEPLWRAVPSEHPELLWVLLLALWAAAFISFLRRHYSHTNESALGD
jgi:hypothetical protein